MWFHFNLSVTSWTSYGPLNTGWSNETVDCNIFLTKQTSLKSALQPSSREEVRSEISSHTQSNRLIAFEHVSLHVQKNLSAVFYKSIGERQQCLILPRDCLRIQLWFNQNIRSSIKKAAFDIRGAICLPATQIWIMVELQKSSQGCFIPLSQCCRYSYIWSAQNHIVIISLSTFLKRPWII